MPVTSNSVLPLLVAADDQRYDERHHVIDVFTDELSIVYSVGPPFGERLITWPDLERIDASMRGLRRAAIDNLYDSLHRVRIHGEPPALMLSFGGLESSVLLADEFWDSLEGRVPGDLVVGVPARDVVIVTGTQSRGGMEKARRAVDRVFFARDPFLLSRDLLVRRYRQWEPIRPVVAHLRRPRANDGAR